MARIVAATALKALGQEDFMDSPKLRIQVKASCEFSGPVRPDSSICTSERP
jgi:hypothetical protein